ncbi:MAG: amino acid adenylation domain-containing protein, partial [Rhodococcus sp. (in: high G+C Gram-positive bacteria)]|uniref:amino acid adenylation domain-containing protein n=1 Tax=Rhodococcus sp. TaxID=1831 RepID=UPI003BB01588
RSLPSYMVPDAVTVLSEMPVSASGKLDRRALPDPVFADESREYVAPRSAMEESIAELFAEILGVPQVSVGDSFFALGGDSIVSIQLVSRAKEMGVLFSARDVFERKTVAALAEIAKFASDSATVHVLEELPGAGIGTMPLTPVVRWMTEPGGDFHRFSQSILLTLPVHADRERVVRTLTAVVDRHDALRSSLYRNASEPDWVLEVAPIGSVDVDSLVERVEFTEGPGTDSFQALTTRALDRAADTLDPSVGCVVRFVWFAPAEDSGDRAIPETDDSAAHRAGRLLVVIHHLAVDGVSWRVLVPDLVSAWAQVAAGAEPLLPAVGTSVRRWAHGLADNVKSPRRVGELDFWTKTLQGPDPLIGSRALDGRDVVGALGRVRLELSAELTEALVTTVPRAFHGGVNDGLLTALTLAVAKWRETHGVTETSALVHLEGHGREEAVLPGADLSRTVGWFTSMYPVRLSASGVDLGEAFAAGHAAGSAVKAVKEQLAAVPEHGIGYGMLRFLNAETRSVLEGLPSPQISFNYLGRVSIGEIAEAVRAGGWIPDTDTMELSGVRNSEMPVRFALDINAMITNVEGEQRLSSTIDFPSGVLTPAEVEEFSGIWHRALESLVEYAVRPGAGGRTRSDFDLVAMDQAQIEALEDRYPALADVWSLAPLQAGLLFHAAFADESVDVYTSQLVLDLGGVVDAARLRHAAESLIARHPNLRAAFVLDDSGNGMQVVLDRVAVPWREVDLTSFPESSRNAELERLIEANRTDSFDMAEPPLVRFLLVRVAEDRYRFAITNHHILLDGWSLPILIQDLLALYAAAGAPAALPPARPYRDYLKWLAAQDSAESLAAWSSSLAGFEEPTLIADLRAASAAAPSSAEITIDLPDELLTAMTELSRELGVTMNTLVQAAWGIVLGRITGRRDVVFGTTVSGRPPQVAGVESILGIFINTIPVRVRIDSADTVRALLERIQLEQIGLLDHHHVGLTEIQQGLGIGALFDTLMVYESYPLDREALTKSGDIEGLRVLDVEPHDATHYPLAIVAMTDPRLHLVAKFLPDLFHSAQVEQIMARVVRVLDAMTADAGTKVSQIDVLAADERDSLLAVRGSEDVERRLLADILADAAAQSPDHLAVVAGDTSLTYAELDDRSNRLARVLIERGVGPETFVAVGMTRSLHSVITTWAVAKAGGAFVPVDPRYPAERIEHMLVDSGSVLGVTVAAERESLPAQTDWLEVDSPECDSRCSAQSPAPVSDVERTAPLHMDQPAYMIYTSGTTGTPKGVVVAHSGLANFAAEQRSHYGVTPSSRTLHFASPSFDASVLELLLAFGCGATMVVAPADLYGGEELRVFLADNDVTHAFVTPAALASVEPTGLDRLEVVVVGGEACPPELVERWAPGHRMYNAYGPTEATVMSNVSNVVVPGERIEIGGPICGVTVYVLDEFLRPVPVGVAGELYIAGPGLARGYHDRRDLTAERFVANPFGTSGTRLYRTGDVVRFVVDEGHRAGYGVEYVGRSDFQVKVRGFRIELGEIDAALVKHPKLDFAVTTGRTMPSGATALVSYVLPSPGSSVAPADVTSFVGDTFPAHMIPSAIIVLDEIPLTGAGKLDRNALPEPDFDALQGDVVEPRTPTEELVSSVFAEVLGLSTISVTESFFDLGGNSLIATKAVARLNAAAGTRLGVRELFEAPTVESLA